MGRKSTAGCGKNVGMAMSTRTTIGQMASSAIVLVVLTSSGSRAVLAKARPICRLNSRQAGSSRQGIGAGQGDVENWVTAGGTGRGRLARGCETCNRQEMQASHSGRMTGCVVAPRVAARPGSLVPGVRSRRVRCVELPRDVRSSAGHGENLPPAAENGMSLTGRNLLRAKSLHL
jgi:hypothetical protein